MKPSPFSLIVKAFLAFLLAVLILIVWTPLTGNGQSIQVNQVQAKPVTQQPGSIQSTLPPAPNLETDPSLNPLAESTSVPLRFTLPNSGEAPISLWRPPLYKIPWALGPYDHFYFSRPIAADEVNWPLADYRYGGIFPGTDDVVHTGIDIDAPKGTPVMAAGDGTVVWAGYGLLYGNHDPKDPYGQAVTIRHDFGYNGQRMYTVYAHMDRIDVVTGQEVQTGTQIGLVGETGNVTGPHLHFEVRIMNNNFFTTLNPELWLAPPQGWGMLVGHMENTNGSMLDTQYVTVRSKDTGHQWVVRSYGPRVVNGDGYYHENVALSDLPAGNYQIIIDYLEDTYTLNISIHPGAITYFSFRGKKGFKTDLPSSVTDADWLSKLSTDTP
jgi:murein DD-endopeptidase MepM/ murein hydrolase activator NlpD